MILNCGKRPSGASDLAIRLLALAGFIGIFVVAMLALTKFLPPILRGEKQCEEQSVFTGPLGTPILDLRGCTAKDAVSLSQGL